MVDYFKRFEKDIEDKHLPFDLISANCIPFTASKLLSLSTFTEIACTFSFSYLD